MAQSRSRIPATDTPELEKFVAKVESGRYNPASEVVREALRLLEEHDSVRASQLEEFNEEIGRRLASLDRGEAVDPAAARATSAGVRTAPKTRRVSDYILARAAVLDPEDIWDSSRGARLTLPTGGSRSYSTPRVTPTSTRGTAPRCGGVYPQADARAGRLQPES